MFKVMWPPLPGLEFGLLNALVPFAFMIGMRGPMLVREPVVRVEIMRRNSIVVPADRIVGKESRGTIIGCCPP